MTLAVLASAMVWSGSQRNTPASVQLAIQPSKGDAGAARAKAAPHAPVHATADGLSVLTANGREAGSAVALQPVGYQASLR